MCVCEVYANVRAHLYEVATGIDRAVEVHLLRINLQKC